MAKGKRAQRALEQAMKDAQAKQFNLPSVWGTSASAHRSLDLVARNAFDAFVSSKATLDDWRALAERVNVFQVILTRHFNNPEFEAVLRQAENALRSINQRYNRTQSFGWSGEERSALLQAVELCEEVQRNCLRREIIGAYSTVSKETGSANRAV